MSQNPVNELNCNTALHAKASDASLTHHAEAESKRSSRCLQEATLYAMKLKGMECSRDSLLHGLPPEEVNLIDGMMRAIHKGNTLQCMRVALPELKSLVLPSLAQLKGDSAAWGVIESYNAAQEVYRVSLFDAGAEGESRVLTRTKLEEVFEPELISISEKICPEENSKPAFKRGFSAWLWQELKGLRGVYRDIIVATLVINLFALAGPLFVMNVYDRVVPNQAVETLWVLASGLALVIIFELLIKLLRLVFLEQAGKHLDLILSSKLFSKIMNIRMESFPSSVGSLASQVKEFDSIKQFFTAATMTALADVPFALIFLLVIAYVGGGIVWVPLIAATMMVAYGFVMHFPIKRLVTAMQVAAADKNSILVESIAGIETIKSLNAQGRQQGFWETALARLSHLGVKAKHLTDSVAIVSSTLMQVSSMFVVIVGVYQMEQQALSLGALIACVLLSSRALAPMAQIANLVSQYQQARSALKGLDALTLRPAELSEMGGRLSLAGGVSKLEVRDLSYAYTDGPKVLKNLSLSLEAGEKVAIIGKIGSGKSSLLRLLQGFGRVGSGQLLVNGYDLQHLDMSELRASIGYVPQEINLFRGSLRENIVMKSPDVSQQALLRAVEVSGLKALVQSHEMGLDMPIGEQGKGLSGGQRQCVAIARALINDPGLLLFDELTSSMDNQTEQLIINNIRNIAADKILLLSTHRASLLALVERIIVMDQGKIIADGPKENVLDALKRGLIQAGDQPTSADSGETGRGSQS